MLSRHAEGAVCRAQECIYAVSNPLGRETILSNPLGRKPSPSIAVAIGKRQEQRRCHSDARLHTGLTHSSHGAGIDQNHASVAAAGVAERCEARSQCREHKYQFRLTRVVTLVCTSMHTSMAGQKPILVHTNSMVFLYRK